MSVFTSPALPLVADGPQLSGLFYDYFFAPNAQEVLIDRQQDAQISLATGTTLKTLNLFLNSTIPATIGIKTKAGEVELSSGLDVGSEVRIDGIKIGTIASGSPDQYLEISFDSATATKELVEKLIHALTYKNMSGSDAWTSGSLINLEIIDSNDKSDNALIFAADQNAGTAGDDVFHIANEALTTGDSLGGAGGHDTLVLTSGGQAHISDLSAFSNVETIIGSAQKDFITLAPGQLANIHSIDGGGGADVINILNGESETVDLRGKVFVGITSITYQSISASIIVDDFTTAKLLDGRSCDGETVTVANGILTDEQRLALHQQGIDMISNNGRTTTIADVQQAGDQGSTLPTALFLSPGTASEGAAYGTVVGSLSALGSIGMFTYSLIGNADGRFSLKNNVITVADGTRLDYEQMASYILTVRVTNKNGLFTDKPVVVQIGDVIRENLSGTAGADYLVGGADKDSFKGLGGNDTLLGGAGNDTLSGGLGRDILFGGSGKDVFLFNSAVAKTHNKNIDAIIDFKSKQHDAIWLDNSIFKALGRMGTPSKPAHLNPGFFLIGNAAHDADDHVIYNNKNHALYYDPDGIGSQKPIPIAVFSTKVGLSAKDIFVV